MAVISRFYKNFIYKKHRVLKEYHISNEWIYN